MAISQVGIAGFFLRLSDGIKEQIKCILKGGTNENGGGQIRKVAYFKGRNYRRFQIGSGAKLF
jgi:hypothetical protein